MKLNILITVFGLILAVAAGLKQAKCGLPNVQGLCDALFRNFYYDANSNECILFYYGGCGGNENNFKTKEECEEACKE